MEMAMDDRDVRGKGVAGPLPFDEDPDRLQLIRRRRCWRLGGGWRLRGSELVQFPGQLVQLRAVLVLHCTGIMSSTSDGTENESVTVLPVPDSCSEFMSAIAFGSFASAEREQALDDLAEVVGRLHRRASRRAACRLTPPSMWVMTAKVLIAGSLLAISAGQLRLVRDGVEAADRPGVVALVDVGDELHHVVVAGDAVGGELRVDGALDRRLRCRCRRGRARGTRGMTVWAGLLTVVPSERRRRGVT